MLKNNIISALCAISLALPMVAAEQSNNEPVKGPQYGRVIGNLGLSVGLGALIGAVEGKLCYHGDKHFPFFIPWFVLIAARNIALTASEKAMDEANVPHDKRLLENSVWIASWVAYIMTWQAEQRRANVTHFIINIDLNSIRNLLGV
ncbi:MAG: hypothetical protein M1114_02640 [Candidatus Dependentiae bacterium]|nr:hypothetical protein [Candidatus Dependentiae bacterium]